MVLGVFPAHPRSAALYAFVLLRLRRPPRGDLWAFAVMWSKNGKEVLRDIEAHDLYFPEGTPLWSSSCPEGKAIP